MAHVCGHGVAKYLGQLERRSSHVHQAIADTTARPNPNSHGVTVTSPATAAVAMIVKAIALPGSTRESPYVGDVAAALRFRNITGRFRQGCTFDEYRIAAVPLQARRQPLMAGRPPPPGRSADDDERKRRHNHLDRLRGARTDQALLGNGGIDRVSRAQAARCLPVVALDEQHDRRTPLFRDRQGGPDRCACPFDRGGENVNGAQNVLAGNRHHVPSVLKAN